MELGSTEMMIVMEEKATAEDVGRILELLGRGGGGGHVPPIAGPGSGESREQLLEAAAIAKRGGATMLRGGAFKPRTSPYAFQGLGIEGLEILAEARER